MITAVRNESQPDAYVSSIARNSGYNGGLRGERGTDDRLNADEDFSIILFGIGKSLFALPTMSVLEVVRSSEIVAIPRAPDFIEGIIEIREQVIPIVDLRKRLGVERHQTEDTVIIVALIAGTKTGFIVDSARKVIELDADEMQDLGNILSGPERRYVYRTVSRNNEPIVILNIDTILKDEELSSLSEVGGKQYEITTQ